MSKKLKIALIIAAVVIVIGVSAVFALNGSSPGAIETAIAEPRELSSFVIATGDVKPAERIDINVPAAGTLSEVLVENGDEVVSGQVIARMDAATLRAQVEQARAAVAQARAGLESINKAVSPQDLSLAQASYDIAVKQHAAAKLALTAVLTAKAAKEALIASDPTTTTIGPTTYPTALDVANAQAAVDQAYLGVKNAEAALARAKNPTSAAARESAEASYRAASEALALAEDALSRSDLVSPVNGTVFFSATGQPAADGSLPTAAKGTAVSPAMAPFSVVDMNGLVFKSDIDEADVSRLEVGMKAQVSLDAFAGKTFEATVVELAKSSKSTLTGGTVFPITLSMSLEGENVLIGMKGDVSIELDTVEADVAVPLDTLFEQGGEQYVYKVVDGKLKKTIIETGAMTESHVEVVSGLKAGDEVALAGLFEFTDGMSVGGGGFGL